MAQAKTRKVTLAVARVINGKNHKADTTVSVSDLEARDLIRSGLARTPEDAPSASQTPAATATDLATATAASASTTKGK